VDGDLNFDSNFGKVVDAATRGFQAAKMLPMDGVVCHATWQAALVLVP
jgi:hypothetical protein